MEQADKDIAAKALEIENLKKALASKSEKGEKKEKAPAKKSKYFWLFALL
jgi:hypothetical protein